MAIGDALVEEPEAIQPIQPAPAAELPAGASPGELASQLQLYRSAFANLPVSDDVKNMTLMRMGFNLMQPVKRGDTPGGVFARAGADAIDYYSAMRDRERSQALSGMEFGMRSRESQARVTQSAEAVESARQARGVAAARAPVDLATAQLAQRKAKSDLDLVLQEEAAGNRSPEHLRRKAAAEVALRESMTRMYDAHAKMYGASTEAMPNKNKKQTVNVRPVENADGTTSLVSTVVVNGEPYFHTFTPARFQDIRTATEFAKKEVEKETPSAWNPFAGAVPYQGTPEEETARRAKRYMTPSLQILGPQGEVSQQQYTALGETAVVPPPPAQGVQPKVVPPATASQMPVAQRPSGSPTSFPVETPGQATAATERSLGVIRGELRDARQRNAPAAEIANLEREEKTAAELLKKGGSTRTATTPGPTVFERGQDGKIVPQGRRSTPVAAPVATPVEPAPAETAGQALDQARASLMRARSTLMNYGVRQQRSDPVGYRNALMEVARLQDQVSQAQTEYERLVAPNLGAARMPVRAQ